jgi:uncharacterized protein (DUF736 family)
MQTAKKQPSVATSPNAPRYRVLTKKPKEDGSDTEFVRIGAGWVNTSKKHGREYIRVKLDDGQELYLFIDEPKPGEIPDA